MTENPINPAALYDYAASKNDMDSLRPEERTFLEACAWEWERLIDHGAEEWGKQFEALGIKPGVPQAPSAKPTPAAPEKPAPSSPAAERADEGLEEEAERLREAYTNDEGSWLEWPDCRQEPWLRVARAARALRRGGVTEDCVVVDREGYYALVKAQQERDSLAAKLAEAVREVNAVLDQLATARAEAERLRGERDEARKEIQSTYRGVQQMMEAALGRTLERSDKLVQPDFPSLAAKLAALRTAPPAVAVTDVEKAATTVVKKFGLGDGSLASEQSTSGEIAAILHDCTRAASVEDLARKMRDAAFERHGLPPTECVPSGDRLEDARAALRALGVREAEKNATPFVANPTCVAGVIAREMASPEPWNVHRCARAAITEYERQRAEHQKGGGK